MPVRKRLLMQNSAAAARSSASPIRRAGNVRRSWSKIASRRSGGRPAQAGVSTTPGQTQLTRTGELDRERPDEPLDACVGERQHRAAGFGLVCGGAAE